MVELREPLEELIHSPRQFTSGTSSPRANEIRRYDTTPRLPCLQPRGRDQPEAGASAPQPDKRQAGRQAARGDQSDQMRAYHHNLNSLGLMEGDLVANALALGPGLE